MKLAKMKKIVATAFCIFVFLSCTKDDKNSHIEENLLEKMIGDWQFDSSYQTTDPSTITKDWNSTTLSFQNNSKLGGSGYYEPIGGSGTYTIKDSIISTYDHYGKYMYGCKINFVNATKARLSIFSNIAITAPKDSLIVFLTKQISGNSVSK